MPARRMFFSISRAWPSSSSIMHDGDGLCVGHAASLLDGGGDAGRRDPEGRALAKRGLAVDRAAEPVDQRADMGEADALARLVLGAGAAEQLEDALVVLCGRCRGRCRRPRRSRVPPCDACRARAMRPGRPGCRYFTAFSIRLAKTCSTASRSRDDAGQRRSTAISAPDSLAWCCSVSAMPREQRAPCRAARARARAGPRATAAGWR